MLKTISEFRKAISSGKDAEPNCLNFLSESKKKNKFSPIQLKEYHEALLFALAYSPSKEIFSRVNEEISRLELLSKDLFSISWKSQTVNSGLPNSVIQSSYSLTFVKHIIETYPKAIKFHSFGSEIEKQIEIFSLLFPLSEREQLSKEKFPFKRWLIQNFGTDKQLFLRSLVRLFSMLKCNLEIKEKLYADLIVFIEIRLDGLTGSQFSKPINFLPFHFHSNGIQKSINAKEIICKKGLKRIGLTEEQKTILLTRSRTHLATFLRETDPLTYTNQKDLHLFDCGRGFSVFLMSTQIEKRQVFDTYLGYVAFKNGIPCAYGGAWLFGSNAKIGLNIFPAFRGGESNMIFCQLMRIYSVEFGVSRFTIEPYQIGKGNLEAINSGAFWFYYKLGFRSVDDRINNNSAKEFSLLQSGKLKASSIATLKLFSNAEIELRLPSHDGNYFDSLLVSEWVSSKIVRDFHGDRSEALMHLRSHWIPKIGRLINENEMPYLLNMLLFFSELPSIKSRNSKRISELIQLLVKKIGDKESDYLKDLNSRKWLKNEVSLLLKK